MTMGYVDWGGGGNNGPGIKTTEPNREFLVSFFF